MARGCCAKHFRHFLCGRGKKFEALLNSWQAQGCKTVGRCGGFEEGRCFFVAGAAFWHCKWCKVPETLNLWKCNFYVLIFRRHFVWQLRHFPCLGWFFFLFLWWQAQYFRHLSFAIAKRSGTETAFELSTCHFWGKSRTFSHWSFVLIAWKFHLWIKARTMALFLIDRHIHS